MAANPLRCNDCGSVEIEVLGEGGLGKCRSCGALVILPKQNDEILNLLNLAYLQRAECNFDSAISTYRFIIDKDSKEIAAYEGLLLAKYGIEYVRDRRYNKFVPTCHRAHFKSVYADEDYQRYLALCTPEQRIVFRKRASEIDELQRAIAKQLESEEDFDVFVCYKATDNDGRPTEDSFIAREIYDELTGGGYRVFFAEKTLENRLGENYEPIIFKALQTSDVFILVGTTKDNVESVWVRNEWSRFLDRILDPSDKEITSSAFVPVFRNMSPYDMPKVGNRTVQGVDASKIGYVKIISDGIDRLKGRTREQNREAAADVAAAGFAKSSQSEQTGFVKPKDGTKTEHGTESGYDWNRKNDPFIEPAVGGYGTKDFIGDVKRISRNISDNVKRSVKSAFGPKPDPNMTETENLNRQTSDAQWRQSDQNRTTVNYSNASSSANDSGSNRKSNGFVPIHMRPQPDPSQNRNRAQKSCKAPDRRDTKQPQTTVSEKKHFYGRDVWSYICLAIALILLSGSYGQPETDGINIVGNIVFWLCFLLFMILFLVLRFSGRNYPKGSTASMVKGIVTALSIVLLIGTLSGLVGNIGYQRDKNEDQVINPDSEEESEDEGAVTLFGSSSAGERWAVLPEGEVK